MYVLYGTSDYRVSSGQHSLYIETREEVCYYLCHKTLIPVITVYRYDGQVMHAADHTWNAAAHMLIVDKCGEI